MGMMKKEKGKERREGKGGIEKARKGKKENRIKMGRQQA